MIGFQNMADKAIHMFVNILISDSEVSKFLDQLFTKDWYTNGSQVKSIIAIWYNYQESNQLESKYMTIFLERLAKRFVEKSIFSLFRKSHSLSSSAPGQLQQDIEQMKLFFTKTKKLSVTQVNEIFEPLEHIQTIMQSLSHSIHLLLTVFSELQLMS
jgi:hypothetical protein